MEYQQKTELERAAREGAKVGDKFLLVSRELQLIGVFEVTRVTPTQITLGTRAKLRKEDGHVIGAQGYHLNRYVADLPHIRQSIAEAAEKATLEGDLRNAANAVAFLPSRARTPEAKRALLDELKTLLIKYPA